MAIIDDEQVLSNFVKEVRAQVGHLLSDLPRQTGQDPLKAVIKDIQAGNRPDYPYIVLTIERDAKESGGWLRHQYVDDDDIPHYVQEQDVNIRVTCYGDNCTSILKTLRILSLDDFTRGQMMKDPETNPLGRGVGAIFQDYGDIVRRPVYLSTDFVETAFMVATFVTVSDWANIVTGGIIEKVEGGGYAIHYKDQPVAEGIPIDFTAGEVNN